jgi:hypothetical protein
MDGEVPSPLAKGRIFKVLTLREDAEVYGVVGGSKRGYDAIISLLLSTADVSTTSSKFRAQALADGVIISACVSRLQPFAAAADCWMLAVFC